MSAATASNCDPTDPCSLGRPGVSPIGDERLQQVHNLLLTGRGPVELPTHFSETLVHLREAVLNMGAEVTEGSPQVDEIFPQSVEARRCCLPEVAQLAAELADVPIGRSREDARRGRVLLTCPDTPVKLTNPLLECGHT